MHFIPKNSDTLIPTRSLSQCISDVSVHSPLFIVGLCKHSLEGSVQTYLKMFLQYKLLIIYTNLTRLETTVIRK